MVTLAQLVVAEDCGSSGPGFKPQMLPLAARTSQYGNLNGCTEYKLLVATFDMGVYFNW